MRCDNVQILSTIQNRSQCPVTWTGKETETAFLELSRTSVHVVSRYKRTTRQDGHAFNTGFGFIRVTGIVVDATS